jgi:ribose transport system substrate-binding protein
MTSNISRHARRLRVAVPLVLVLFPAIALGATSHSKVAASSPRTSKASQQAAAAKQAEQQYLHKATTIDQTVPLKTKPTQGRTMIYLQCELPQCVTQGAGFSAAAKAIGWKYKSISYDSANPAQLVAEMQQSLQYHPVAVAFTGGTESQWSSVLPAYKAAHVGLIPINTGPTVTVKAPVIADLEGPTDVERYSGSIADWFVADSGATGNALLIDVPAFAVLHEIAVDFRQNVSKACSACKVTTLSATIPDVENGSLNSLIIAALRRNPKISYVVSSDAAFIDGLPSALNAAGLGGKVKLAGVQGDATDEQDLNTGTVSAVTGFADEEEAWVGVDAAARYSEGMKLQNSADGGLPTQLILKSSHLPPADSYPYPTNYPSLFKKLWHIS